MCIRDSPKTPDHINKCALQHIQISNMRPLSTRLGAVIVPLFKIVSSKDDHIALTQQDCSLLALAKLPTHFSAPYANPDMKEPLEVLFKELRANAKYIKEASECNQLCLIVPYPAEKVKEILVEKHRRQQEFYVACDYNKEITEIFKSLGVEEMLCENNEVMATKRPLREYKIRSGVLYFSPEICMVWFITFCIALFFYRKKARQT
eukprot:TRINITY_DN12111_c0_g1_i4.p1 TRINITY_DN12111_c0_g1~~TRINITY_DN12111_c0_g1_i4.p1  ORF type:complete len:206 (-),score=40.54 TRINITY_DN12111_c0_g1_i4:72-689(-)